MFFPLLLLLQLLMLMLIYCNWCLNFVYVSDCVTMLCACVCIVHVQLGNRDPLCFVRKIVIHNCCFCCAKEQHLLLLLHELLRVRVRICLPYFCRR